MKLLFEKNLLPKLPRLLATQFPDSAHIQECGLLGKTDREVWEYARTASALVAPAPSLVLGLTGARV
ncbi:MAG TPA: DUF5615 family PIN-like protein [Verrucomicrobiota bacterium]|nr:hypothetical protein [Verrucomicrobiales bacterium]HRI14174.1 DUF5615 family PIN-like protein [Verrucomicrobiota bacterium]